MAKTAIPINKESLINAINEAEKTSHPTQGALFEAVVNIYNSSSDIKITPATARNRMAEWNLTFSNQPAGKRGIGRAATEVDQDKLTAALTEAEKDGALSNRSLLYTKVAELYNNGAENKISPSVVNLRIESWKLVCKTEKARIRTIKDIGDEPKPSKAIQDDVKIDLKPRYGKEMTYAQNMVGIRHLLTRNGMKKYMPLADKIANGSKAAAIKLNCLQCCGFEKKEVKYCTCTDCPMFTFRPYRSKSKSKKIPLDQV